MAPKSSVSPTNDPPLMSLPNWDQVQLTHTYTLALPQLPSKARCGHIVPGLAAYSLLSVVKLCNAGCDVTFTKINCTVCMQRRILMTGRKDTKTGLCMLPLAMDESMISHVAASTISQGASDILEPFALQAAHQNAQDMPYLHTNNSQDI